MADLNTQTNPSYSRTRVGVKRMKRHLLKIDMTPMVDLGFLLISFFVITTELSRPKTMNFYTPHDGKSMPTAESKTITFLAGANDQLFYYLGEEEDAGTRNPIIPVLWNGENSLRQIIREKQKRLDHYPGGRDGLVILIKPGQEASYKNVVDMLDEMIILGVKRYAVLKSGEKDQKFLQNIKK